MVEVVHKGLDDRCGIVDLGLQQFAGALAQPDQRVIGDHHMEEHRERATDDGREQQVS